MLEKDQRGDLHSKRNNVVVAIILDIVGYLSAIPFAVVACARYVILISTSPLSTERLSPSSVIILCCILEELVGAGEERSKVPLADDRYKFKSLRPPPPPAWGDGASVKNSFPLRASCRARLSISELKGSSGLRLRDW
jgi:hypothetical protein